MSKQQFFIKDPLTNKKLVVSRDVYNALNREQGKAREQQETLESKMKQIGKTLSSKYYEGKQDEVELALKFKEDGSINFEDAPQLALHGELENLDSETKAHVQKAMYQMIQCVSEALSVRAKETESKVKQAA